MSELVVAPFRCRQATRQAWGDRLARHVTTSSLSVAAFGVSEGVSVNSRFPTVTLIGNNGSIDTRALLDDQRDRSAADTDTAVQQRMPDRRAGLAAAV